MHTGNYQCELKGTWASVPVYHIVLNSFALKYCCPTISYIESYNL